MARYFFDTSALLKGCLRIPEMPLCRAVGGGSVPRWGRPRIGGRSRLLQISSSLAEFGIHRHALTEPLAEYVYHGSPRSRRSRAFSVATRFQGHDSSLVLPFELDGESVQTDLRSEPAQLGAERVDRFGPAGSGGLLPAIFEAAR